MAHEVREVENVWTQEIFGSTIDSDLLHSHNSWRVNNLLSSVGLEEKDTSLSNTLIDLYRIGNYGDGSQSKSNVLETKTSSYTNAGSLDWDF